MTGRRLAQQRTWTASALGKWVMRAQADRSRGRPRVLTSVEREELGKSSEGGAGAADGAGDIKKRRRNAHPPAGSEAHLDWFPSDFMFQVTWDEVAALQSTPH